jgi:K+-sensing histidine kinase KdpD
MSQRPPSDQPAPDVVVALLHDLRTPLAIVSGFAELLVKNEHTISTEQRRDYVERIAAAAEDMRELLDAERARRRSL